MGRFRALSVLSLLLIPEPYVDNRVMNVRLRYLVVSHVGTRAMNARMIW